MNRAPTLVRPAANERQRPAKDGQPYPRQRQLGQHVVLTLPRDSGRVADAPLPEAEATRAARGAVPTFDTADAIS